MSAKAEKQKSDRVAIACVTCRLRKVRCTGGHPCKHCSKLGTECTYPPQQRRKRTTKTRKFDLTSGHAPVAENVVHVSDDVDDEIAHSLQSRPRESDGRPSLPDAMEHTISVTRSDSATRNIQRFADPTSSSTAPRTLDLQPPHPVSQQSLSPMRASMEQSTIFSPAGISISDDFPTTVGQDHAHEVVGDKTVDACIWLSACSNAGVAWVCQTTASRTFAKIAERFTNSVDQPFSSSTWLALNTSRAEPAEETAWEYVNAFFENCWEARLGIIQRADFEAQLQAHFHDGYSSRSDSAEIALRNVVFAAGYRSILAETPNVSFTSAQKMAWQGYFQTALSVLTRLLLSPSRLMVVQALALMACYVEGLGSPRIQRVLCHNAVHTAITQGLHLESDHRSNSSSDDSLKRAWLWWAVYALEKHLSFSSRRLSMIDDCIISVPVPSTVPLESAMDLNAVTLAIRHAKICSRILREVMSNKAQKSSPRELQKVVKDIDQQLRSLLDEFPSELRIGTLAKQSEETHPMSRRNHNLFLYFSIHGSLLAIHSQFFYPWLSARIADRQHPDASLDEQVISSSNTVAEAARKILLAIRTVTTNVATPTWLAFTYPIYAHLSLLIYVLRYPTLPTFSADLGLLDICAGHFGYIDFMTSSQISVSLPRESVNLAAKVVKAARKRQDQDQTAKLKQGHDIQGAGAPSRPLENRSPKDTHLQSVSEALSQGDSANINLGAWNMLPSFNATGTNDYNYESVNV